MNTSLFNTRANTPSVSAPGSGLAGDANTTAASGPLSSGNWVFRREISGERYHNDPESVAAAQNRLRQIGYYGGAVTGALNAETAQAIRDFHTVNQTAPEGSVTVGMGTAERMFDDARCYSARHPEARERLGSSGGPAHSYTDKSKLMCRKLGGTIDPASLQIPRLIKTGSELIEADAGAPVVSAGFVRGVADYFRGMGEQDLTLLLFPLNMPGAMLLHIDGVGNDTLHAGVSRAVSTITGPEVGLIGSINARDRMLFLFAGGVNVSGANANALGVAPLAKKDGIEAAIAHVNKRTGLNIPTGLIKSISISGGAGVAANIFTGGEPAPYPSSSVILVLDVKEGLESFEDVTAYVEEKTGLKFPAAARSTLPKEPPDYTDPQTFGLGRISPF